MHTQALLPLTGAFLSYWSLGQLPITEEVILPQVVHGVLVAANLLLLVYFASASLRSAGGWGLDWLGSI